MFLVSNAAVDQKERTVMGTPFSETLFRAFYGNIEDISDERKRPRAGRVFQTRRQILEIESKNDEQKGGKKERKGHLDEPEEEQEGR